MPTLWIRGHALRQGLEVSRLWVGMGGGIVMQEGIYHDNFGGHAHPLVEQNRAILARHNALVEAVAWERECEEVKEWLSYIRHTDSRLFLRLISSIAVLCGCARAEVDRLIANADDCEGEG